jgi:heme/copper-type cytochrome/quinol oxidase subunit 2
MVVLMKQIFTRSDVLRLLAIVLAASAGAPLVTARQEKPHVVEMFVERFSFTPSEVRVKAGAPLEIRLRSDDTDHGFRIVGTDVDVAIPKRGRGIATVRFVPPKAGKYVFECSKLCGAGHSFMRGTLIAE